MADPINARNAGSATSVHTRLSGRAPAGSGKSPADGRTYQERQPALSRIPPASLRCTQCGQLVEDCVEADRDNRLEVYLHSLKIIYALPRDSKKARRIQLALDWNHLEEA